MTTHIKINDITARVSYTASSSLTYSIPFPFFTNTDIKVYLNGTLATYSTDYSVSGAGSDSGGSITFVASQTGKTVLIIRAVPFARTTDFPTAGPFNIDALNTDLDKMTAQIQQVRDKSYLKNISFPDSDSTSLTQTLPVAASRANKALIFDASGNVGVSVDNYIDQLSNVTTQASAAAASATAASNSAGTASTQATNAGNSASAASTSASAASTSATNAAASASAASGSATAAAGSATSASGSASTATTQATNASTSASTASTAATNASNSASAASTSATNAASSATTASTAATNAGNSATAAAGSATTASTAATNAQTYAAQLPNGAAIGTGKMPQWNGSAWVGVVAGAGDMVAANNLSDLANKPTAITNLGAQAALVSGTNIKTINGSSLLGSGDIAVATDQSQLQNNTLITAIRLLTTTSPYALMAGGAVDAFNDLAGIGSNPGGGYDPTNKWFDATTDANWANVTALLRLQNNATDESGTGTTFTATSISYSTSVVKFGSYSATFNGSSSYITNGASQAAYQVGTGSVTIEGWFYPTRRNGTNYEVIACIGTPQSGGSSTRITVYLDPTTGYVKADIAGGTGIATTVAPTLNQFFHYALVRNGASAWTLYVNGTSAGTLSNSTNHTDGYLTLGRDSNSSSYQYGQGNHFGFKFTKGVAVYTGNFTPRTADYVIGTTQTLTSTAFTAVSAPTSSRVLVRYQDVASAGITLNTDISMDVSRDGGTTWTAATLANAGAWDASTAMASASVTVSAQPSGTSVKYRIRTSTTKALRVRGSGLLWS